ncbi:MAG: hypothetical protein RLZZ502_1889 [Pseudomonadota bacterium]|jgi:hypothetical protein
MRYDSVMKIFSLVWLLAVLCTACQTPGSYVSAFDQSTLPESIQVGEGYKIAYEAVGLGTVLYRCTGLTEEGRRRYVWQFVGPDAKLLDREGVQVGTYTGPPTYFQLKDGSGTSANGMRVSSNGAGNLTLQILEAHSSNGNGALTGVKFIQRINTKGGAAPANGCTVQNTGAEQKVQFQADYIYWR